MKLKIEKILKKLALKEYAEGYAAAEITVWTNPPREMRKRLSELKQEFMQAHLDQAKRELDIKAFRKNNPAPVDPPIVSKEETEYQASLQAYKTWILEWNLRAQAWYAEIWSQGEDAETHLSEEEVERACESSPDFVRWLIERTNALFVQQREQEKKA